MIVYCMCRSAHAQLPRHNQYGMDSGRRMSDIMTNLLSFVGSSWKTISSRPKSSSGKKIANGSNDSLLVYRKKHQTFHVSSIHITRHK